MATPVCQLPIIEPTILTDPYKGRHVLRWNKSRGQSDTGRLGLAASREASFTIPTEDDDLSVATTPYRLPRISPRGDDFSPQPDLERAVHMDSPEGDKVWSRYGFEKIIRIPELGPQIRVLMPPPKNYLQQLRNQTSSGPKFKSAAITPSTRSLPWNLGCDIDDPQVYRSHMRDAREDRMLSGKSHRLSGKSRSRTPRLEPTPTPISRSQSPTKSIKSIHWVLGHNRYHTFDKKGRSHVQGPYSREFNVTCMAPTNWLKMKWGRSKAAAAH